MSSIIGLVGRVFANGLGVQSQVELYKDLKNGTWYVLA